MTQGATHGGARDVCAFTVSAKAVARETGAQGERFWSSHIGSATAAAMFVPALTILILVCHPRQGSQVLRRESPPRAIGSPSVGSRPLDHASHGRTRTSSCSLAGRILDTQGEPSAHATVRAVAVGEGAPISAAIADDDGRFCLTAPAMSRARIVAEDDGDGLVESAEVESGATHDVVLVLGHAVRLTGVVLDERDAPGAQAKVKSWGGSAGTEKIATTDDEGRYVIERMAPGARRVTALGPGYGLTTVAAPRPLATL